MTDQVWRSFLAGFIAFNFRQNFNNINIFLLQQTISLLHVRSKNVNAAAPNFLLWEKHF